MLIANCFYPCIKCHLPKNFHFRYSFNLFASKIGLKKIGNIPNTHTSIFEVQNKITPNFPTNWEIKISYILFFALNITKAILKPILKPLKNILLRRK